MSEKLATYHERRAADAAEVRARLRLARRARATAEVCGKCGRPLAADEAVWRARVPNANGSRRHLTIWCLTCAPRDVSGGPRGYGSRPCDMCQRIVWVGSILGWQHHLFCSTRCEARWYRRQRSLRAQPKREKVCAVCGQPFTASRRDALTCGHKCRQRAYRRRTDGLEPA